MGMDVPYMELRQQVVYTAAESQAFLEAAAALDPLTWRVLLRGCHEQVGPCSSLLLWGWNLLANPCAAARSLTIELSAITCTQPMLVHAVLAALPPTVRQLRLQVECRGPLCNILQRFTRLNSLSIDSYHGNAVFVQWRGRGAAHAIPKLTSLRLDCREQPDWYGDDLEGAVTAAVPAYLPASMAAATQLTSLELLARWQPSVDQLCAALPALEELRCGLSWGGPTRGVWLTCDVLRARQLTWGRPEPQECCDLHGRLRQLRVETLVLLCTMHAGSPFWSVRTRTLKKLCLRWEGCRACGHSGSPLLRLGSIQCTCRQWRSWPAASLL